MIKNRKILPVLLCGGSGSRLWPISRQLYPKQLLALGTDDPLVIDTAKRVKGEVFLPPLIVCNEDHRFLISTLFQKEDLTYSDILLEPFGRNTAPAAVVASCYATQSWPETPPLVLLLPSDHLICDHHNFHQAVLLGAQAAEDAKLVTFGIRPNHPETGYGYIKSGSPFGTVEQCHIVEQFVEKPNQTDAQRYVESQNYFWNSGIFLFDPATFLQEAEQYAPEVTTFSKQSLEQAEQDPKMGFHRLDAQPFEKCSNISIDYAIMEKTKHAVMVAAGFDWNDIGSWQAIWDQGEKDTEGNVTQGEIVTLDTHESYIQSHALTAVIGLDNVVVVATEDAILVMDRHHSQKVKDIVAQLKAKKRDEYYTHKQVYRPWGSYKTLALGHRYQVKEICVHSGASLSLQYHHHRAEHWIVVEGTAKVTRGDEVFILSENQSTYIPLGEQHRLSNPGKTSLKLIEVQSGSYLKEDDIVRLEDHYDRL